LEFGAVYQFRVQSRCGDVTGEWTQPVNATNHCGEPGSGCPNAVNVRVECVNGNYLATWQNSPSGQPDFWTPMWRLNEPGAIWTNATISGVFNTYDLPGNLLPGRQYQFRIRSRCGTTVNLPTAPVSFFTSCAAGRLADPATTDESFDDVFVVYPNPTHGAVELKFTAGHERAKIEVRDLAGKLVLTREVPTVSGLNLTTVALPETAKGTYVLGLTTQGQTRHVKLTVE
jgi:hypothetical protein